MPTIAIVEGVKIQIFFGDHPPPHFHARFAEHQALFVIPTLELLESSLPAHKLESVRSWAQTHSAELIACWQRAVLRQNPGRIE
jgi:Domain of unknown function (DUF4160)